MPISLVDSPYFAWRIGRNARFGRTNIKHEQIIEAPSMSFLEQWHTGLNKVEKDVS